MRALVHLATLPPGTRQSQQELAGAINAPAAFMGKVLQQLANAGLLRSQRGSGGGFVIEPAALKASMLDAITAVDGPVALNACLAPDQRCERVAHCPAHLVWREAQARALDVLRGASIEMLAARVPRAAAVASAPEHTAPATGEARESPDGARPHQHVHARGENGLVSRPRGRDVSAVLTRPRGAGHCHRKGDDRRWATK